MKNKVTDWTNFSYATLFYDDYALVDTDAGLAFLDKQGKLLNKTAYYDATIFHDGIAWVVESGGPLTAINKKGEVLFELKQAKTACAFHDGVAAFSNTEDLWGLVSNTGNIVVEPQWTDVIPMVVDGLIAVKVLKSGWCLADRDGKIVSDYYQRVGLHNNDYEESVLQNYVQALHQGRIPVQDDNNKWGIIDREGNIVINPQFDDIYLDGKNYIFKKGRMYGWCDEDGQYLINPQFGEVGFFENNDLAPAENNDGDWGYIDKTGKWVINAQFRQGMAFLSSGIAPVQDKSSREWGAIDKDGKWVINPQFRRIYDLEMSDRLFVVDQSSFIGIIDTEGKYVISPNYDDASQELLSNVSGIGARYEAESDYVDIASYAKLIDDQIHSFKSSTVGNLLKVYGLKEYKFPKGGGEVVLFKKNVVSDMNFKVTVPDVNAWNKTSDGWFGYNYTFRPDVRIDSYTFVVEFNGNGKAWRFVDQIADELKKKYTYDEENGTLNVEGYQLVFMAAIPNGGIIFQIKTK